MTAPLQADSDAMLAAGSLVMAAYACPDVIESIFNEWLAERGYSANAVRHVAGALLGYVKIALQLPSNDVEALSRAVTEIAKTVG